MMKLKLLLGFAAVAFFLGVLATTVLAQDEVPPTYVGSKNPFPWDDTSAQEMGKELYQRYCSICHGTYGNAVATVDFTAADYPQRLEEKPDFYFWVVSEGRTEKGMPPYRYALPQEQRWQILTYLRSLSAEVAVMETKPSPEVLAPLDCLSHHSVTLKSHDVLGKGSEACWACHLSTRMTTLHLAGGQTQFPMTDFPRLCAQCHQKRYEAWQEGTHGVAAWKEGDTETRSTQKLGCTSCHNPHQPQIVLSGITKPPLTSAPPPPPVPLTLLAIVGAALLLAIILGIVVMKRGEWPWGG